MQHAVNIDEESARTDIGHDNIASKLIEWILPTAVLYSVSNAASISSNR